VLLLPLLVPGNGTSRTLLNLQFLVGHDCFAFHFRSTVQVDQDVDEPWPLEVYGHDGKATNVTMEPGTWSCGWIPDVSESAFRALNLSFPPSFQVTWCCTKAIRSSMAGTLHTLDCLALNCLSFLFHFCSAWFSLRHVILLHDWKFLCHRIQTLSYERELLCERFHPL
jgi:hypothetical protein